MNASAPNPVLQTHDLGPQAQADIESGKRVLEIEAQALSALRDSLGADFAKAVEILFAVIGRVVVTGMGKSGHVGRKIAATLASTGTPAFFVHPGEASHGDLGMISQGDAVIAISNSGETAELSDVVAYTRRFEIPLVGITSRPESTLAKSSDVALVLPGFAEACSMGLAPTTSTTMTLALGDSLAVALLDRRHFTAADFRVFHPGGKLGQRLLKVGDLMHVGDALPLVSIDQEMGEVLVTITQKSVGCAGVVKDGELVGIITDGDLRRHLGAALLTAKAGDVMTRSPKTVQPTQLAAEALRLMNSKNITSLFVVDQAKPVGVLHIHDLLRAGIA